MWRPTGESGGASKEAVAVPQVKDEVAQTIVAMVEGWGITASGHILISKSEPENNEGKGRKEQLEES